MFFGHADDEFENSCGKTCGREVTITVGDFEVGLRVTGRYHPATRHSPAEGPEWEIEWADDGDGPLTADQLERLEDCYATEISEILYERQRDGGL